LVERGGVFGRNSLIGNGTVMVLYLQQAFYCGRKFFERVGGDKKKLF